MSKRHTINIVENFQRSTLVPTAVFIAHEHVSKIADDASTCKQCVFEMASVDCATHACYGGIWVDEATAAMIKMENV